MDKAVNAKRESSALARVRFAEGKPTSLVPSDTVAPNSFHWYNTNIWSVAQTTKLHDSISKKHKIFQL